MKKIILSSIVLMLIISSVLVSGEYITNNRDTQRPPERLDIIEFDTQDYNLLIEFDDLAYYYRPETDALVIEDKVSGYAWKSGIDMLTATKANEKFNEAVLSGDADEIERYGNYPVTTGLSTTNFYKATSLVTIEYFKTSTSTIQSSSLSSNDDYYTSEYRVLNSDSYDETHFTYDINFHDVDIEIRIDFYFTNEGLTYEIRDENIKGDGEHTLKNILVMPYFGAQGGSQQDYKLVEYTDPDTNKTTYSREATGDDYELPMADGYSFIPDGSGALVRFKQNTQSFEPIHLSVYGKNLSTDLNYTSSPEAYKTVFTASMPVFGMAVGNDQSAFVSYTTSGDNYMTISCYPDESENNIKYNRTNATFNYNFEYNQVYNQAGDSSKSIKSARYNYDVVTHMNFLSGTEANYLGMADSYRESLMDLELLFDNKTNANDIPLHIDFLMADSQSSILGYENVVMTTYSDVDNILTDIKTLGISNINASLLGFEDGGITLSTKDKVNFTSSIGSKSKFKDLITDYSKEGIDISFMLDYYEVNDEMISYSSNVVKHTNGWYTEILNKQNKLIKEINFLRPDKALQYANKNIADLVKDTNSNSISLSGITNNKISHFNNSVDSDMANYEKILELSSDAAMVNAYMPNSYLWQYVTRYLNADPFNSQFLFETDTVPFISYVLNPVMEVYASHANFSFYNQESILRMIDYNMSPSFVITNESSHLLSDTNSSNYYSTEYSLYKGYIDNIYNQVNNVLSHTYNAKWINREVIQNGVIVNSYNNDVKVVINYTNNAVIYMGKTINAMSSEVIN